MQGALVSIIEVWVMCTVIFLGISVLPPGLNLFLLNGVCIVQVILDICNCKKKRFSRGQYSELPNDNDQERKQKKLSFRCYQLFAGVTFLVCFFICSSTFNGISRKISESIF